MTDTEETAASEPTIEEWARTVLDNALDEISRRAGGKVYWSLTTIPAMLTPVLIDLDRHMRKPMPTMPKLQHAEPSAEALRRRELIRAEEQRYRWTGDELAEAIRDGM